MGKKISTIVTIYFIIGLLFAFAFAFYYRWPTLSYLSPNFYVVVLTWPFQAIGFIQDIQYYGLVGKPI